MRGLIRLVTRYRQYVCGPGGNFICEDFRHLIRIDATDGQLNRHGHKGERLCAM